MYEEKIVCCCGVPGVWVSIKSLNLNRTDLRTLININQPLCRGFGGGTRPKMGGLGGSPPILVSPKNDNFSLKSVSFHLT